jgi:hypothetical protein
MPARGRLFKNGAAIEVVPLGPVCDEERAVELTQPKGWEHL